MIEQMAVHETVIRDIMDVLTDVKNSDTLKGFKNDKSFRSIAQASSNLTLVFPVMVSKNLKIENAAMVTKATERKCVVMLQMLFSALSITDSKNGIEYLKNFHTNLKMDDNVTVDGFIDALDRLTSNNESGINISNIHLYNKIKEDMRHINYFLPDSINESSIQDYKMLSLYYGTPQVIKEKKDYKFELNVNTPPPVINVNNGSGKGGFSNDKNQQYLQRQLLDNDVKKSNELVPTSMIVNFITLDEETGETIQRQMVIGVKAKIYPLDSSDIINRLKLKHEDKNGLLKLIKATTREISFTRDFLFAIDKAKIDALSQSKRGSSSKMWKILERRSLKSKIRRNLGMVNDASAITSLAISQEEVEYLKKMEGIDLEDPSIMRPIMESLNFMSVIIVDESMEAAKFLYDTGNDIYETVPFKFLERESSDQNYKKVINLMSKMR